MTQTLEQYKEFVRERLQAVTDILPSIAAGDFSKRLDISYYEDEFTELYVSINYLLEDLQENFKVRGRAEEALKASEKRYRSLAHVSPVGIFRTDEKGNPLYLNQRWSEIAGITFEESKKNGWVEALHPDDRDRILREWQLFIEEDRPYKVDCRFLQRDGQIRWVYGEAIAEKDEKGTITGYVGTVTDITERKKMEEKLLRSEAKYRSLVEKAGAGVAISDVNGDFSYVNNALCKMIGYSEEEFIGKPFIDFIHPEDGKFIFDLFQSAFDNPHQEPQLEFRVIHKEGHIVHLFSQPTILWHNDEIAGFNAIITDITERKRAEEALRQSEEKLRLLFEGTFDLISLTDKNAKTLWANPAWREVFGKESEYEEDSFSNIHPDDQEKVVKSWQDLISDKDVIKNLKYRYKIPGGEYLTFESSAYPVIIGEEQLYYVIARDITERMKAEEAIRKSEERLRIFFDTMEPGIFLIDAETHKIVDINSSAENMTGTSRENIIGSVCHKFICPAEKAKCPISGLDQGIDRFESLLLKSDGDSIPILKTVNPILINNRKHLLESFIDLTKLKKTEKSLQELKEKLNIMFDSVSEGIAFTDLEGNIMELNNAAVQMHRTGKKEELIGKSALELLPEKEQAKAFKSLKKTIEFGQSGDLEFTLVRNDGSEYEAEFNATLLKDDDGNPIGLVSIIRDITERKKAEKEMKRKLIRYDLEDGTLYLVKEHVPGMSIEAFKDLLKVGYEGLVISRTPRREFKAEIKGFFEFLWISEKGIDESLPPKVKDIERHIEGLARGTAILLDRLDYLVSKNGFKKTLTLVHRMREIAYFNDHIIILSIDPSTLSEKELRQLEKEAMEVESQTGKMIPEDLLEVLRFVNEQNRIGARPTYTYIGKELRMSKPTVRKRIRQLTHAGYVIDSTKGRSKIVELTEKGRSLFLG